jgi:RNA polymerase sigma-70 factor (ECF subfamily)
MPVGVKTGGKRSFSPGGLTRINAAPDNSLEEIADTSPNSDPLATASGRQLENDVKSALNKLPQRQRTIFQLKVFQEMSIAEIAEALELAEGTVKTHLKNN